MGVQRLNFVGDDSIILVLSYLMSSDQLFSGQDLYPERFAHATLVSSPSSVSLAYLIGVAVVLLGALVSSFWSHLWLKKRLPKIARF